MCLDHPEKVARAAIIDIIPQHHLYNNVTKAWATFSWHWFFNIQPYDMPERMMGADPDWFIKKKLAKTEQGLSFFDPAALADFMRCFRNPETIHAICEDYRAGASVDLEMDDADFKAGRKVDLPGAAALGRHRRRRAQPASPWKSGRAMPPTSAAARRCRAGTMSTRRRRRKPIRNYEPSSTTAISNSSNRRQFAPLASVPEFC